MDKETLTKINKVAFPALFIIFAITFYLRNNYKTVDDIIPEAFKDPIQTTTNKSLIRFTKNDYKFEITPLYDYKITGLVVSKFNYDSWFSIYKVDKIFMTDLCIIWGNNLKKKTYKNPGMKFSQDMRFCRYNCGKEEFYQNDLSNNHLIVKDEEIRKKVKQIRVSDQICVSGQLVKLSADLLKGGSTYDGKHIIWQSSTSRIDSGHGACEVIYVQDIQILKKGNVTARAVNFYCLMAMLILATVNLIQMAKPDKNLV